MDIYFIFKSIFLGIGLAMDAFSLSLANGLNEPAMKKSKEIKIAITFAIFQYLMPMIGYIFVSYLTTIFTTIKKFLPFISFCLLLYIGCKLILDGIKTKKDEKDVNSFDVKNLTFKMLVIQGVITSIDALSVGFTMSTYNIIFANISTMIIGLVTFVICIIGVEIGKYFGMKYKKNALLFGGCVLIIIGISVFFRG